jgi:hypothetical protein
MLRTIALAATLLSAAAIAQDGTQTPASAQLFLKQVMEEGDVLLEVDTGKGWNIAPWRAKNCDPGFRKHNNPHIDSSGCMPWEAWHDAVHDKFTMNSASAEQRDAPQCGTAFYATAKKGVHPEQHLMYEWAPPTSPYRVSWGSVSMVEQVDASVVVKGSPSLRFSLSSDQLAARVAYAMEFLRLNCDSKAATGF